MAKGYTYEELLKMGAEPAPEEQPKGKTYEEVVQAGAVAAPEVGPGETYVNRAVNTIPFAKPVVDAGTAAVLQAAKALGVGKPGVEFTPEAKEQAQGMGLELDEGGSSIPGAVETYRQARDTRALRTEAGSEQNPRAAALGTATGIGLSLAAPLPKVSVGTGAAGRIASGGLTGAGYGAGFGLTHGKADLTKGELEQATKDVLGVEGLQQAAREAGEGHYGRAALSFMGSGGIGGGVTGAGVSGLIEGARGGAEALRRLAINQGRRTIQGSSDIAAATRKPLEDESVEEVLKSDLIKPFSSTQKTYERIEKAAGDEGRLYAQIVEDLESLGVKGPNVRKLADELFERYAQEWPKSPANKAVPQSYLDEAMNVEAIAQGKSELGLKQAEGLKRNLQRDARFDRLKSAPTEEAKQEISSIVRRANEDAIDDAVAAAGSGSPIAGLGERFVPVKQRLGRLLDARSFAERGASKASQRQQVGIKDAVLGAATGNPFSAYAAALASSVGRNRIPSTIASGAYKLSEALKSGSAPPTVAARITGALEAPLMSRIQHTQEPAFAGEDGGDGKQASLLRQLPELVRAKPELFGKYGPVLQRELQANGEEGALAVYAALLQEDPDFAASMGEVR